MGNICQQQANQSSTHQVSNLNTQLTCLYQFDEDFDNPKREALSSKFLQTNVDASNRLLEHWESKTPNRQTSAFWNDTIFESQKEKELQILKKKSQDAVSKGQLPSVKVCYGDFVSISKKKIEEKYRIIERIGAGAFGEVFKAQNQLTGEIRAIKIFKKHEMDKHRQQIEILKLCDHPNIIQIYQIFEHKNSYHVVMEYCQGGSIINLIKNNKYEYLEDEARTILEQILHALIYLHGKGIIHRDIKLENVVFMQPSPGQNVTSNLKIIDFGNAQRVKFKVNRATAMGGTTMYMPPQAFAGWYSQAFDIWSCGVMLCILLTGFCPFKKNNRQEIINLIKNSQVDFKEPRWSKVSSQAKQLTKRMLLKDFTKRPSAQQCLQNSWFQSSMKRSQLRKASQRFTKNLTKYYAINNFVSVVESYLSFRKISQSQKNEIKCLFQAIDVRRQGQLSKNDILKTYEASLGTENEEKIKKLIEAIDKNKSGFIDYSEFQTVMSDRQKLFIRQSLENAFDYFDYDGSGFIEKNQLLSCLKDCEGDIQQLITEIDKDHDDKISKEQFIKYFEKIQKQLTSD